MAQLVVTSLAEAMDGTTDSVYSHVSKRIDCMNTNNNMPIIHPRHGQVRDASLAFRTFCMELEQKYDLTYAEMFRILGDYISSMARYAIQDERSEPNVAQ